MGKRLEDLKLDPTPIEKPTNRSEREVTRLLDRIAEMRGSGDFHWADDTLRGIEDSVAGSGYVTDGQQTAIDNIEAARTRQEEERGSSSGRSRRYEGFRRY